MTEIERYLASEQAREDVRALLAMRGNPMAPRRHTGTKPLVSLIDSKDGAWRSVSALLAPAFVPRVYYRQLPNPSPVDPQARFIVTDLGEGARALRLRTGRCFMTFAQLRRMFESTPDVPGVGFCADTGLYAHDGKLTAFNLPDAICRIMLASWHVAIMG